MRTFKFNRNKRGTELLIDCLNINEIADIISSLKELHTTSFYEIYFLINTNGTIQIENKKYTISDNCIILLPPLVARQWDIQFKDKSYVVFFEEEVFNTFLQDEFFLFRLPYFGCNNPYPIFTVSDKIKDDYISLVTKIKSELENLKDDSINLLKAYLYGLLIIINRGYTKYFDLDLSLVKNSEIIHFKKLVKENIQTTQTVSEYADLMGTTRNHLNDLCLKAYGKNANEFIRSELILACKHQLIASCSTVSEIAHQFNFSAPSNFTRLFKTAEGISPTEYRGKFKH